MARSVVTRLQGRIVGKHFPAHGIGMIGGHINVWGVEQERLGQTAIFCGNAGESLQFLNVYDGEIESGLNGVVEEEGINDFAGKDVQPEDDVGDSEDRFDVQDLLLDETD